MARHRLKVAKQTQFKFHNFIGEGALARGTEREFRQGGKRAGLGADPAAQVQDPAKTSDPMMPARIVELVTYAASQNTIDFMQAVAVTTAARADKDRRGQDRMRAEQNFHPLSGAKATLS